MISHVVAMARNRVIGRTNDLPWYLPADLRHFKQLTLHHTVLMGRKTFDSIFGRLGKPLPERRSIVVSRSVNDLPGVEVVSDIEHVLAHLDPSEEVFVIGGASIYERTLDSADRLYITEIAADANGDTYYPDFNAAGRWREVSRETHVKDERNPYDYSFVLYERRP